jgi:MFS family permease
MTAISAEVESATLTMQGHSPGVRLRSLVIGLTAFLTVVDLFATQAILPSLARHYNVTPAAMGFAVNASTMGMAIAGLVVGIFSEHIDRRRGILLSLAILAIPTTLLAVAPNLVAFTILRVCQGLCMASAFALTLAYLGEQCSSMDAGGAFAAYITGNVASNLIGRLVSATVVDTLGLASNFYFFAALNLAGAVLVYLTVQRARPMHSMETTQSPLAAMMAHCATRRCARHSESASASCSPLSAPSPSSTSCWFVRRYHWAGWIWDLSISSSRRRLLRRCSRARRSLDSERGRRYGAHSRSQRLVFRSCCHRI